MADGRIPQERNLAYGSAKKWFDITPSDSVLVAQIPDAVYITGDGNLVAKGSDGVSSTFPVVVGQILPIRPQYVMEASTATLIGLVCS